MVRWLGIATFLLLSIVADPSSDSAPKSAAQPVAVIRQAHDATLHTLQETVLGSSECSATAIAPHAILTASHCELGDDALSIQENDIDTTVLGRMHDGLDHTIYLVAAEFDHYVDVNQGDPLDQVENVYFFGNPADFHDVLRRGYVAGVYNRSTPPFFVGPDEILFDFHLFHGDSGAGIFNDKGQLVAVVTGTEAREESADDPSDSIRFGFSYRLHFTDAQLALAKSFVPTK